MILGAVNVKTIGAICMLLVVTGIARAGDHPTYPSLGSTYVLLESWIYPAFDRLAALGYAPGAFTGMRPWTRVECARLVQEAGELLQQEELEASEARRFYRDLELEFAGEVSALEGGRHRGAEVESVYARFTGLGGRPLTDGYHFGQTIVNDYGRPYQEGANAVTGFAGRAVAGRLAVYVRGEYQHAPSAAALPGTAQAAIARVDQVPLLPAAPLAEVNRVRLLDAYASVAIRGWQVSFGKQSLWWGPVQDGPLLFSNNIEPIPMLRVSRVHPFKFPALLSWMGPVRVEFFLGQLSGHKFIFSAPRLFVAPFDPQPFLHGGKISFKPTPNLEFGVAVTSVFGGPGFPFTFRTFARSAFSIGNAFPGTRSDPGDRRSAFDFRYRIPGLRKWLVLYNDSMVDDEFSPIGYPRRAAMNTGIYMPQIPGIPKLDLRAEAVYTNLPNLRIKGFFYVNDRYRDGYTHNGNLIGSWVGRQGRGFQIWSTYWSSSQTTIQIGYRNLQVDKSFLQGGTLNDFGVNVNLLLRPDLTLSSQLQYERWRYPLLASWVESNLVSSFQLTFHPNRGGK